MVSFILYKSDSKITPTLFDTYVLVILKTVLLELLAILKDSYARFSKKKRSSNTNFFEEGYQIIRRL